MGKSRKNKKKLAVGKRKYVRMETALMEANREMMSISKIQAFKRRVLVEQVSSKHYIIHFQIKLHILINN